MPPCEADEILYQRVQRGDMAAFDRLYERYEQRLFGFILRMVHNRSDAEDLFHEAFLGVLRSREVRFGLSGGGGSFCTWLYRIARNACLNHLRGEQRQRQRLVQLGAAAREDPPPPWSRPEGGVQAREEQGAVALAVARLPLPLSEVYHLRAQGLSYEDMAQVLEVPLGTVKSRMNQMIKKLREDVSP